MNEDKKWLKSGLRYEGVAQKCRPFNVFNCSLDAPKEKVKMKLPKLLVDISRLRAYPFGVLK